MNSIEQVLDFWLGTCGADGSLDASKTKMWFGDGRKYDDEIRARFGALHERAARSDLGTWTTTARGRLALIIVLDQFSRHIHRGTAAAFAQDPQGQELAVDGIAHGHDRELIPAARSFFYLPFEHAENLELQELGVRSFEQLAAEVGAEHRKDYESFADYARRHRDIIARFGR